MRLAVLSDLHSNHIALRACLTACGAVDGYVLLGDYVSDLAYPQKTLAVLRTLAAEKPCTFLRGNREDYMLSYRAQPGAWRYGNSTGSLLYTFARLTERDFAWFAEMPIACTLRLPGCPPLLCCHGSPSSNTEERRCITDELLRGIESPMLLCGHTHQQELYVADGKTLLNPGAVGLAIGSGGGAAQCALLDGGADGWQPTLLTVPYDLAAAEYELAESGLIDCAGVWPRAVRKALRTGVDYPLQCVRRARALAAEAGVADGAPDRFWNQAAAELEL